jgi:hypothetical protein
LDTTALAELLAAAPAGCRTDATANFLQKPNQPCAFSDRRKQTCDKGAA